MRRLLAPCCVARGLVAIALGFSRTPHPASSGVPAWWSCRHEQAVSRLGVLLAVAQPRHKSCVRDNTPAALAPPCRHSSPEAEGNAGAWRSSAAAIIVAARLERLHVHMRDPTPFCMYHSIRRAVGLAQRQLTYPQQQLCWPYAGLCETTHFERFVCCGDVAAYASCVQQHLYVACRACCRCSQQLHLPCGNGQGACCPLGGRNQHVCCSSLDPACSHSHKECFVHSICTQYAWAMEFCSWQPVTRTERALHNVVTAVRV